MLRHCRGLAHPTRVVESGELPPSTALKTNTEVLSTVELDLDRFLTPFDIRRLPVYSFDVLVVGSGAAGSVAALTAASAGA